MNLNQFIFISLLSMLCSQCTIQKRLYRPGYSIEFRKHNQLNENNGLKHSDVSIEEIVVSENNQLAHIDSIDNNSNFQVKSQILNNEIAEQKPINLIQKTVKFIIPLLKHEKSSSIKLLKPELPLQKLHKDSTEEKRESRVVFFLVMFLILIFLLSITALRLVSVANLGLYLILIILAVILGVLAITFLIALMSQIFAIKKATKPSPLDSDQPQTDEKLKAAETKKKRFMKARIGSILLFFLLLAILTISFLF